MVNMELGLETNANNANKRDSLMEKRKTLYDKIKIQSNIQDKKIQMAKFFNRWHSSPEYSSSKGNFISYY